MRKFKFFINYDKEEKWLNETANKGYQLEKVSFGNLLYQFSYKKPENTIIRIDYRLFKNQKDFIDYCTLFEDSGWEQISGSKYSGAQYFKKTTNNTDEDIFSDQLSKAGKYQRLSQMWINLVISYLPIFVALVMTGSIDLDTFFHPELLYFTPGLWEMEGVEFWGHFLFETPFALLRGLFLPLAILLFIFFSIKARKLYFQTKQAHRV